MKMISSILAIAAVMTTADAMFADVTPDYLNTLRATYIDPNNGRCFSTAVNSDVNVRFFVIEDRGQNDVSLKAEDPPQIPAVPPRNHPTCGSDLGVYILKENRFFCKINLFKIDILNNDRNEPRTIRLILHFKKDGMLPLALGIPIFKLPAAGRIPQNEPELTEWGRYYGVGTKRPFDFQMLSAADETKSMLMDFRWLNDLLGFGVIEKRTPTILQVQGHPPISITTYITRPILLPEDLMVQMKEFIDSLNDSSEESVGSNPLSWRHSEEEVSSLI